MGRPGNDSSFCHQAGILGMPSLTVFTKDWANPPGERGPRAEMLVLQQNVFMFPKLAAFLALGQSSR